MGFEATLNTEEFMGSKPSKISASRVSSILGINPWKTELELWHELMEETYPGWLDKNGYNFTAHDISSQPQIKIGNLFEDPLLNHCFKVVVNRERFFCDGVLSCHIDAKTEDGLAEAKTTSLFSFWSDWGVPGTDQIPDYYYCQTQVQMGLSGESMCTVPVLIFPERQTPEMYDEIDGLPNIAQTVSSMDAIGLLKIFRVNFNAEVYSEIKQTAEAWWWSHITKKTPPLDNLDAKNIVLPVYGEVDPTVEICNAISLYKNTEKEGKAKSDYAKLIKSDILKYMVKNAKQGKSDFVRIRRDNRVLATYNGKTGRFSIKGEKDDT